MAECPRCGHCWEPQDPLAHAREIEELRAWCREHNHWVGPGGTISTDVAAELTERAKDTLRDWRANGIGPPFRKIGGAIRYTLADIATFRLAKK